MKRGDVAWGGHLVAISLLVVFFAAVVGAGVSVMGGRKDRVTEPDSRGKERGGPAAWVSFPDGRDRLSFFTASG